MSRLSLLLAPLLLAAQDPSPAEDLQDLVERACIEDNDGRREDLLRRIGKFPLPDIEKALRTPRRGPAGLPLGRMVERVTRTDHDGTEFRYGVHVSEAYDPSKRWPLLITLHGTNMPASDCFGPLWAQTWVNCAKARDAFIIAGPTTTRHTWSSRPGHSHVLTVLRQLSEELNIDPDRVYLDGMSMGAGGTFNLAQFHPEKWAAIAPRCNVPHIRQKKDKTYIPMLCENFRNVPLYWVVGAKDDSIPIEMARAGRSRLERLKYDMTYREFPEGGHDWSLVTEDEVFDWMSTKTRETYPREVVWKTYEEAFPRAYWVEVLRRTSAGVVTVVHQDMWGAPSESRAERHPPVLIRATRNGNAIDIHAEEATRLRIWLDDSMVDLDRPVTITVNGVEEHRGKVRRSLKTLFDQVRERRDRSMLFTASVEVKVSNVRKGEYPEPSEPLDRGAPGLEDDRPRDPAAWPKILREHTAGVLSVVFHPNGRLVASAGEDGWIRTWDVEGAKEIRKIACGLVSDLDLKPDGEFLAAVHGVQEGPDRKRQAERVSLFNPKSGERVRSFPVHEEYAGAVRFLSRGRWLVTASIDGSVRVWEADSGRENRAWRPGGRVVLAAADPAGTLVAAWDEDRALRVWDAKSGEEVLKLAPELKIVGVRFAAGTMLTVEGDRSVVERDASTGEAKRTIIRTETAVSWLAVSPDGRRLALLGAKDVLVIDRASGAVLDTLQGHSEPAETAAFSADGALLATGGHDRSVRLWRLSTR